MASYVDTIIAELNGRQSSTPVGKDVDTVWAGNKKKKQTGDSGRYFIGADGKQYYVPVAGAIAKRDDSRPEGYSYDKNNDTYRVQYAGMKGVPDKRTDEDFPTGGMSLVDTFPTGAMSEAPTMSEAPRDAYTDPDLQWRKDGTTYKVGKYGETPITETSQRQEEAQATADDGLLVPLRPTVDWDKEAPAWNPTLEELGVSYAGGLTDYAVDPEQIRSATNGFAPDESVPAAVDPMQYMSANGLLPREPSDLSEIQPEAQNNPIPTWARVAMGLADALRISGTRGGLYPETAVEDDTAYIGATMDQALKQRKQEAELEKASKANDIARARILSQAAMSEEDPQKRAEYGRAIKQLLPRETQGLDPLTAAGMFTGDDKIALEREKQRGRMLLQELKGQQGYGVQELKGQQALDLQGAKHENKMEEMRLGFANQTDLESHKSALRMQENEQKHGYAMALQTLKNEGAIARRDIMARGEPYGKARGTAGATSIEEMNRIGLRTAPEYLAELKALNEEAGSWNRASEPSTHDAAGRAMWSGVDYGAAYAAHTNRARAYARYSNLLKQMVQDQLRKIYGAQFTEKEGDRFFESMGINPITHEDDRWALAMNAINDLRLKYGYDMIDPDTLQIIPNTGTSSGASATEAKVGNVGESWKEGNATITRVS